MRDSISQEITAALDIKRLCDRLMNPRQSTAHRAINSARTHFKRINKRKEKEISIKKKNKQSRKFVD
jgi:hypothetical protein